MHDSVRAWVASVVQEYDLANESVIDIGSLDVNGTVRDLFTGAYVGIDRISGPNVDIVMTAHELTKYFIPHDVVLCLEMIEHDEAFWNTLYQVSKTLNYNGHLLLTTRSNGFPQHDYPSDYWRFMPASGILLLDMAGCNLVEQVDDPQLEHPGIFLHGVKR
jgi:hypothetical protein